MKDDGCNLTISLLFTTLILCTYQTPVEILESSGERSNTSEEYDGFYLIDTFGPQLVSDSEDIPSSHGYSTVSDNDGNIYTIGSFSQWEFGTDNITSIAFGEISLNLGSGVPTRSDDVYIAKYVPTQGWKWAERISSPEDGLGFGIRNIRELQIAPDGAVIIAGGFRAGAVFGSISLTNENVSQSTNQAGELFNYYPTTDVFIANISPEGQWQWAKKIIGEGNEYISDIAIDDSGNIFIIGSTDSNCLSFEAGAEQICEPPCNWGAHGVGECSTMPQGDPGWNDAGRGGLAQDFFIAKYDDDGVWLSANNMTTEQWESYTEGHHLAIDTDGSAIVSGRIVGPGLIFAGNQTVSGCGSSWTNYCGSEFIGRINSDLTSWDWLSTDDSVNVHHQHSYWGNQILSIESTPLGGAIVRGTIGRPYYDDQTSWNNFDSINLTISGANETHSKLNYLARISSSGEWLWARDLGTGVELNDYFPWVEVPRGGLLSLSNNMAVDSFGRSYITQCHQSSWDIQNGYYEDDGILMVTRYDEFGHLDATANLTNVVNNSGISNCNDYGGIRSIHIDVNNNLLTTVDYWNSSEDGTNFIGGLVISWRFTDPNDLDEDGVPNEADLCPNSNPSATVDDDGCSLYQIDTDNDGVSDAEDECPGYDDDLDEDNDGIPDDCDDIVDSDSDGVADSEDQCPGYDDSLDVDEDGVADGCDPFIDSDSDGIPDAEDECEGHDDSKDVDSDGIPDGCDDLIDSDSDGVSDAEDRCLWHDDRIDVDNDGIPDGCDDFIDRDNDGVPDHADNCPGFDDFVDEDSDGIPDGCDSIIDSDLDGVRDVVDVCEGHDDSIDEDADGKPDGCEMWILTESTQRFVMERFGVSLAILFVFVSVLSRRLH